MDTRRLILPVRIARPRKAMKFVCFLASAALIALLQSRGIEIRRHPLRPHQLLAPAVQISNSQFWELLERKDFFYIATVVVITSGNNLTYTSDLTWNNLNNTVEVIGAGASGGSAGNNCSGAGAGEYRVLTNFIFATPGSTTAQYTIAPPTAGGSGTGTDAGHTFFNGATSSAATLVADGGLHGLSNGAFTGANGGLGGGQIGNTPFGKGGVSHPGGNGGSCPAQGNSAGPGGGGAGGPAGNGSTGGGPGLAGGAADNGTVAGGPAGSPGNSGTEWTTAGCGSGGGGPALGAQGNSGGNFGGGGSAGGGSASTLSGGGGGGLLALSWVIPLPIAFPVWAGCEG